MTITAEQGMVSTRVLDRGKGVGTDFSRVFDSFYRSQGAVERAAGRIWCAERQGGGTEFGFSLRSLHGQGGARTSGIYL